MTQRETDEQAPRPPLSRREMLKTLAAGSGALAAAFLPERWAKPVVQTGVLPAHAAKLAVRHQPGDRRHRNVRVPGRKSSLPRLHSHGRAAHRRSDHLRRTARHHQHAGRELARLFRLQFRPAARTLRDLHPGYPGHLRKRLPGNHRDDLQYPTCALSAPPAR